MLLFPFLGALAAALLAGRLAKNIGESGEAVSAICLLATPLAFYGVNFSEHSLSVAIVLAGLLAVVKWGDPAMAPHRAWTTLGIAFGLVFWVRSELAVLLPLVAMPIAFAPRRRGFLSAAVACAGAVAGLVAGSIVQHVTIGLWLPVHLTRCVERQVFNLSFAETRTMALNHLFAPDWVSALVLATWLIALSVVLASRERSGKLVRWLALIALASGLLAAIGLPALRFLGGAKPATAFPIRSVTTVWVVLSALPIALTGAKASEGQRRNRLLLGCTAAWLVVGGLLASPVDGGFQWGARFYLLTAVLSTLLLLTAPPAELPWERLRRASITIAVVAGIAVQFFGLAFSLHVSRGNAAVLKDLLESTQRGEVIITDTFFVPELAAPAWSERIFLYCSSPKTVTDLLGRLSSHGVTTWTFVNIADDPRDSHGLPNTVVGAGNCSWSRESIDVRLVATRTILIAHYRIRQRMQR